MSTAVEQYTGIPAIELGDAVSGAPAIREADADDAQAIHALVSAHLQEGRLLPRTLEEVRAHAHRFLVATRDARVLACAELAPLSREVAEVRSLVVSSDARNMGLGGDIIDQLARRATASGFERLCAFTHEPTFFVRRGFSIVPHVWLPEKILTNCHACPHFRNCGQYAVLRSLERKRRLDG